jgi:hypothetical protein
MSATPTLNLGSQPLTVGAMCRPATPDGVIVAMGDEKDGFSLYLQGGVPRFAVRAGGCLPRGGRPGTGQARAVDPRGRRPRPEGRPLAPRRHLARRARRRPPALGGLARAARRRRRSWLVRRRLLVASPLAGARTSRPRPAASSAIPSTQSISSGRCAEAAVAAARTKAPVAIAVITPPPPGVIADASVHVGRSTPVGSTGRGAPGSPGPIARSGRRRKSVSGRRKGPRHSVP